MLDGCSRLQKHAAASYSAALPGVICAHSFAFTLSWNEFLLLGVRLACQLKR